MLVLCYRLLLKRCFTEAGKCVGLKVSTASMRNISEGTEVSFLTISKFLLIGHVTFSTLFIKTRPEVCWWTDAAGSAASKLWSCTGNADARSPTTLGGADALSPYCILEQGPEVLIIRSMVTIAGWLITTERLWKKPTARLHKWFAWFEYILFSTWKFFPFGWSRACS